MYQGGVDMLALKEILGTRMCPTTQIYTHINQQQLRDAVQASPLARRQFVEPKSRGGEPNDAETNPLQRRLKRPEMSRATPQRTRKRLS